MVQNLQQIKKKLQVTNNIAKLSKVIEMMAISKLYKKKNLLNIYTIYVKRIRYMLQHSINNNMINNQYISIANNNCLLFIVSPDRGLCGSIVTKLTKKVYSYLDLAYNNNNYIVLIGKKVKKIFNKGNSTIVTSFDTNMLNNELIYELMEIITKFFSTGKITKIIVAYTKFENMFNQKALIEEIWPIQQFNNCNNNHNYMFEPNVQYVLMDLLPYYIEIALYNTLLNAYVSEQAARIIAMKNSRNNACDVSMSLTNFYNKVRQEKITSDILDLSNGNEYLENII
ncbi:MAG: F0F1 ATP synthase subunit gamma [Endomicrobium sp.]|jgi:F-type H+-transporting ATPase subunit gamma|nr:F0F1 ATP synthase subunit gamma [Endomicrobium sp.]